MISTELPKLGYPYMYLAAGGVAIATDTGFEFRYTIPFKGGGP